jgi:hypothetical protein
MFNLAKIKKNGSEMISELVSGSIVSEMNEE